jgi:hypothetical protein
MTTPAAIVPAGTMVAPTLVAEAVAWKPINKGNLLGLVDVVIAGVLSARGCPVLRSGAGVFVALPQKPSIGRDDKVLRSGGKIVYESVWSWTNRDAGDAFSASVLRSIAEQWPGSLQL